MTLKSLRSDSSESFASEDSFLSTGSTQADLWSTTRLECDDPGGELGDLYSDGIADLGSKETVVSTLADAVTDLIGDFEPHAVEPDNETGRSILERTNKRTPFHGSKPPPIALKDYLWRIAKHAKCSNVCFVMAYTYILRLSAGNTRVMPCTLSIHRLLITGVMIATKLMDDKFYSNAFYAKIGGISNKQLNKLELEMLRLLEFRACVSAPELLKTLEALSWARGGCRVSKKRVSEDTPLPPPPAKLQQHSGIGALRAVS